MRNPSQDFATDSLSFLTELPTLDAFNVNIVGYAPKLYRRSFFCSPNLDSPRSVEALV